MLRNSEPGTRETKGTKKRRRALVLFSELFPSTPGSPPPLPFIREHLGKVYLGSDTGHPKVSKEEARERTRPRQRAQLRKLAPFSPSFLFLPSHPQQPPNHVFTFQNVLNRCSVSSPISSTSEPSISPAKSQTNRLVPNPSLRSFLLDWSLDSSLLPANYGYTALAGASTFVLHIYQVMQVSKHRKAAKIPYPQRE